MARPSANTDKKLIQAGVKRFRREGLDGLVLREIADDAGVNLGMFHYHFKGKDQFAKEVLKEFYEDFFRNFAAAVGGVSPNPTSIQDFEKALLQIARYVYENASTFGILFKDIVNGEKLVIDFAMTHGQRHLLLMGELIVKCQKKGILRDDVSPKQILLMVATNAGMMSVLGARMQSIFPAPVKKEIEGLILSWDQIQKRIQILLKGLQP